jgi:hypothetical protein
LRQRLEDRDRGPKETVNGRGRVVRIVGGGKSPSEVCLGCSIGRLHAKQSIDHWLNSPKAHSHASTSSLSSRRKYILLGQIRLHLNYRDTHLLPSIPLSPLQHHTPYRYLGRATRGGAESPRLSAARRSMSKYWFKKAGGGVNTPNTATNSLPLSQ